MWRSYNSSPLKLPRSHLVDCRFCRGFVPLQPSGPEQDKQIKNLNQKLDMTFQSCNRKIITGVIFIASGVLSFLLFFFAAVLSKLLPPFQNRILRAIQNDRYYCFLVPLTIPVIVISVYLHWLSMKLFKHA